MPTGPLAGPVHIFYHYYFIDSAKNQQKENTIYVGPNPEKPGESVLEVFYGEWVPIREQKAKKRKS